MQILKLNERAVVINKGSHFGGCVYKDKVINNMIILTE